ncbi:MAG: hypothetical protein GEU94_13925 [Micromonosporaceae bacterium]|nr:hypothetical protein [Micromonosporaceae bacterium]
MIPGRRLARRGRRRAGRKRRCQTGHMAAPDHDTRRSAARRRAEGAVSGTGEEPASGHADPVAAHADPAAGQAAASEDPGDRVLPGPVRQRVVALVAAMLPDLAHDEVPGALRRIARFAPQRRAKLGGAAIAAQIASDSLFRQRVADRVVEQAGELGAAVRDGSQPAAADPVEVAALAYLARPVGWSGLVDSANQEVRAAAEQDAVAERIRRAGQDVERVRAEAAAARAEADRLREQLASVAADASGLREQVRALTRSLRESERAEHRASHLLATEKGRAARAATDQEAEQRRLRAKLAETETALEVARRGGREVRAIDDARLWLLLETLSQAAHGLRRELALEPADRLPADFVAASAAELPGEREAERARALDADDPARLDQLLGLPKAHLIVDGYNVTKRGFGDVSLEQQRQRLVGGMGGIAAQTGAEVTVAFDGADRMVGLPPAPRGVRVLFSRKGQTADDLIRQLVRAEPAGRPVVVISSDREVADGVRRHGAYPLSADALLRRLSRT